MYKLDRETILEVDTFSYLGNEVTKNEKIQIEINERIKKASRFYHPVKGLLRNKNINEKFRLDIF